MSCRAIFLPATAEVHISRFGRKKTEDNDGPSWYAPSIYSRSHIPQYTVRLMSLVRAGFWVDLRWGGRDTGSETAILEIGTG